MKWKIGDKVRLTGEDWPDKPGFSVRRGDLKTIEKVFGTERVKFEGSEQRWWLEVGWEIELVEREEKTMSVDFSEVNVGDKVLLTRENGDETTFKVTEVNSETDFIRATSNSYYAGDWGTLEIVERDFKPVPGLYSNDKNGDKVVIVSEAESYYSSATGRWLPSSSPRSGNAYNAARGVKGWRREITF